MRRFLLVLFMFLIPAFVFAQDNKPKDRHEFKMIYEVKATPVKNQGATGTCWAFATTSFIESELLRMGKGEFDLSEMFFSRQAYISKADQLIRFGGKNNFGQGGQAHDVIDVIRTKGIVPDEAFTGLTQGETGYNHSELEPVLSAMTTALSKNPGRKLTQRWIGAVEGTLDAYMGKVPEKFTYKGKEYTPKSFAAELGINPDDYVEITSYSHHPFYKTFALEVQDNWSHAQYYNVPLSDINAIMEYALKNGYSVDWDGDVSEKEFNTGGNCYSVVPLDPKDTDTSKPEKEKTITDDLRLETFNNFTTTDDHLMHITGMATDQEGTKFWLTKNSWGTASKYNGYWYMSDAYTKLKMIAILVHKNAVPKDIRAKLGF
jgi:bleomycin hydrolase